MPQGPSKTRTWRGLSKISLAATPSPPTPEPGRLNIPNSAATIRNPGTWRSAPGKRPFMDLTRPNRWVYTFLGAIWLLVVVWQAEEHVRFRETAKTNLSNRSKDIANTV